MKNVIEQTTAKPLCSLCNKEMKFIEGDTIYDDRWYHKDCRGAIKNTDLSQR